LTRQRLIAQLISGDVTRVRSAHPVPPELLRAGEAVDFDVSVCSGVLDAAAFSLPRLDTHKTADVRAVLSPLTEFSDRIAGGMTTRWPRPASSRRPDNYGMHPSAEIGSLTRYGTEPLVDVALAGGHLYLTVMRALVKGFIDMGCVSTNAQIVEINGPIGRMRQQLRRWLLA
jgi:hypothetical protein